MTDEHNYSTEEPFQEVEKLNVDWWKIIAIVCMIAMVGYLVGKIYSDSQIRAANERLEARHHIVSDWQVSERMWNMFVAWANESDSTKKVARLQNVLDFRSTLSQLVISFDDSTRKVDGIIDTTVNQKERTEDE